MARRSRNPSLHLDAQKRARRDPAHQDNGAAEESKDEQPNCFYPEPDGQTRKPAQSVASSSWLRSPTSSAGKTHTKNAYWHHADLDCAVCHGKRIRSRNKEDAHFKHLAEGDVVKCAYPGHCRYCHESKCKYIFL